MAKGILIIVLATMILAALAAIPEFFERMVRAQIERYFSGAVVAFDRREQCPEGWAIFSAGYGRVIVGAGGPGDGLTKREFGINGGTESHKLTSDELPKHKHLVVGIGRQGMGNITEWGIEVGGNDDVYRFDVDDRAPWPRPNGLKGQLVAQAKKADAVRHNNMPPFVPLYFCKKSG